MKPYKKILVPTDFSVHADEALDTAIDLAARYGASITLVHAFEPVIYAFPESSGIYQSLQLADAIDDIDKELEKKKQSAISRGAKDVQVAQLRGFPPAEIAEYAKANGCDLIVMGTHGRRGFSHLLMGSVAERVVRIAQCPVLTTRHAEEQAKTPS